MPAENIRPVTNIPGVSLTGKNDCVTENVLKFISRW
jgi:hypothetical protein